MFWSPHAHRFVIDDRHVEARLGHARPDAFGLRKGVAPGRLGTLNLEIGAQV